MNPYDCDKSYDQFAIISKYRSTFNPKLIKTIVSDISHPIMTHWDYWESEHHDPYTLIQVEEGSAEYANVKNLFEMTARDLKIKKLERVENPYLLALYLLKKEKMLNVIGHVQEKTLYHGTKEKCIDSICRYNFDWRRYGEARGHKFGQGVSFTPEVSYAKHYSPWNERVMFVVKVLVGKTTIGDLQTVVPLGSFDTTQNERGTVIVKYEDDDFYPQYVIHYYN